MNAEEYYFRAVADSIKRRDELTSRAKSIAIVVLILLLLGSCFTRVYIKVEEPAQATQPPTPTRKARSDMSIGDRDFQILVTQNLLDVAKRNLRSMPVGTPLWQLQWKEMVALDEELHKLRTEGTTP